MVQDKAAREYERTRKTRKSKIAEFPAAGKACKAIILTYS